MCSFMRAWAAITESLVSGGLFVGSAIAKEGWVRKKCSIEVREVSSVLLYDSFLDVVSSWEYKIKPICGAAGQSGRGSVSTSE